MDKALLDTDTLSEILKAKNQAIIKRAQDYKAQHGVFTISVITVMEVIKGFRKANREDAAQKFLRAIRSSEVLNFDGRCAEIAGSIMADLERGGQVIGRADPMIAGIAIIHELVLISGNIEHYQRIQLAGYPLKIDNWR